MKLLASATNHYYFVRLYDLTDSLDALIATKPEREFGQKYAAWKKKWDYYQKHLAKAPYWVIATFYNDDNAVLQSEFLVLEEARLQFLELATCPVAPKDWSKFR